MNLTIFTAPKPFTNPHIATIQRNAIQSWIQLGGVPVILIGNETGLVEVADEFGILHLPQVACNAQGTPLVSDIFALARQYSDTPLLAYVNADMILLPDFLMAAEQVAHQAEQFLIVGQRWDLDIREAMDFSPGWQTRLQEDVQRRGRLHPPGGSDYFIFPRSCFSQIPAFAIGRAGWDNWMFYHARVQRWRVVNATDAITAIHQDHDYSHLPNGQPHYRLPETAENVRLGGGPRTTFTLHDADYTLAEGQVAKIPLKGSRLWREIETFPLVSLRSMALGEVFYTIFHPTKAFRHWKARLRHALRHLA
ncbi:MAG: hypothetical protein JW726_07125 [Anaerolineales bacterium]|nr:hypothetical protein [Anaerolineales bacterium]